MSVRLRDFVRRTVRRSAAARRARHELLVGRVQSDLVAEFPDEDLREDLEDCLDLYRQGSKPHCEEMEYLERVQDAIDRIARGR